MTRQPFNQRVTIPFFVMGFIVVAMAGIGYLLSGLGSGSTSQVDNGSVSQQGNPSVIVLNGTKTSGLARQVSDVLASRGWVINRVGNWDKDPLTESTVFYPASAKKSGQSLAKEIGAVASPAPTWLSQTSLTYVIMK